MNTCRLCKSIEALDDGALCQPCQDEADEFWRKFANDAIAADQHSRSQFLLLSAGAISAAVAIAFFLTGFAA